MFCYSILCSSRFKLFLFKTAKYVSVYDIGSTTVILIAHFSVTGEKAQHSNLLVSAVSLGEFLIA